MLEASVGRQRERCGILPEIEACTVVVTFGLPETERIGGD